MTYQLLPIIFSKKKKKKKTIILKNYSLLGDSSFPLNAKTILVIELTGLDVSLCKFKS